jgi:enamine deaminase RidA (YjgF/YER057c/UK114 family)
MSIIARLQSLNITLPPAPKPGSLYRGVVICGNLAYVSGHAAHHPDGSLVRGRVGVDMQLAEAKQMARQVGLEILASLQAELGNLDRVKRVVKLLGMVNSTPEFEQHPEVINGCSELLRDLFGPEAGVGARSAVGMGTLPFNLPVEIEAIFEVAP